MAKRIYVGYKSGGMEVFRPEIDPTRESHGHVYPAVVGPFRTVRGAKAMVNFGQNNNPHIRCVSDAERIGKKYAEQLKTLPLSKFRAA
jgi:hypothetical protein